LSGKQHFLFFKKNLLFDVQKNNLILLDRQLFKLLLKMRHTCGGKKSDASSINTKIFLLMSIYRSLPCTYQTN